MTGPTNIADARQAWLARIPRGELVAGRVPRLPPKAAYLKQAMRDKRIEHRQYILRNGQDLPEVRDWRWPY